MFQNVPVTHSIDYHGQTLTLETGLLATQATSTVLATIGQTSVLAAVVIGKTIDMDYFPLQVIYEERMYASGKIKGSRFIKREGRPSDNAILTGRMIDRSLRSLFNSHIRNEIQVVVTVLSLDEINPPDTIAVLAASSALCLATPQFLGPVSSIRVGMNSLPLGEKWLSILTKKLIEVQDYVDISPELDSISATLDVNNEQEKVYLKEIFQLLAAKDQRWALKFKEEYRNRVALTKEEILKKYPQEFVSIINPSYEQQQATQLDLVVSGDGYNIMMVEAGALIVSEEQIGGHFDLAMRELGILTEFQEKFIQKAKNADLAKLIELEIVLPDEKYLNYWNNFSQQLSLALYEPGTKEEKKTRLHEFEKLHYSHVQWLQKSIQTTPIQSKDQLAQVIKQLTHLDSDLPVDQTVVQNLLQIIDADLLNLPQLRQELSGALSEKIKKMVQEKILTEEKRLDGRALTETRKIICQVGVLPRTHGSSLFQRGETQVLNVMTLGTMRDAQTLDDMEDFEEQTKRYIHHYNFPAYSVGETGRYSGPGRREIGHGALAEKALLPVLPSEEVFPYTMRLVSECLGSNGSTSMASTCASCLSLMDGGVPITDMVAGVAMGLVIDSKTGNFKVLTDIQGAEDHNGDMDFKVTGTKTGVTAIQLDNKVAGLTAEILKKALIQAKDARLHILGIMQQAIDKPRTQISQYAPGVQQLLIPVDKIGEVIGPSGKIIKSIIQKFGVEVDIEDNTGKTYIYGKDTAAVQGAATYIQKLIKEYKSGDTVSGKIFRIESYGAFAKIDDTEKEGMIHISNLANRRVGKVEDVVKLGDLVTAKILDINDKGQISLSLKAEGSQS